MLLVSALSLIFTDAISISWFSIGCSLSTIIVNNSGVSLTEGNLNNNNNNNNNNQRPPPTSLSFDTISNNSDSNSSYNSSNNSDKNSSNNSFSIQHSHGIPEIPYSTGTINNKVPNDGSNNRMVVVGPLTINQSDYLNTGRDQINSSQTTAIDSFSSSNKSERLKRDGRHYRHYSQQSSSRQQTWSSGGGRGETSWARRPSSATIPIPPFHQPPVMSTKACNDGENGGRPKDVDDIDLTWMESADHLISRIKDKQLYNMFLAPGQVEGKTTNVSVAIYIESMSSFKAQTMDFEVDMYLAMSWVDHRLRHNFTHPVLIAQKSLAERIWHPDLYFVNSKFAYIQDVTTPNFMILVYPDGFIFKSMRIDVTLSCMMVLNQYPMDSQTCPITIQSYAYIENVLNLTWHEDREKGFPIGNNLDIKLNDMEISKKSWSTCGGVYPMFRGAGHWSCLQASLKMKRLVMFHVIQTYIPTGMLVMISWLSFWLDPRAGPARISLTITTLLTLTTMSNSARQDLPQVSYIKALDIWLSVCTAFVFCVLLEYTLVSRCIGVRSAHCPHSFRLVRKMAVAYQHCENGGQFADSRLPASSSDDQSKTKRRMDSTTAALMSGPIHQMMGSMIGYNSNRRDEPRISTSHHEAMIPPSPPNLYPSTAAAGAGAGASPSLKSCALCLQLRERTAKRIDRFSRVGFPVLFTIFSALYWIWYTMW